MKTIITIVIYFIFISFCFDQQDLFPAFPSFRSGLAE